MTSIFGDGYVELARHAQLASVALYAAAVVLVGGALCAAARDIRRREPTRDRGGWRLPCLRSGSQCFLQAPLRDAMRRYPHGASAWSIARVRTKSPGGDVEWSGVGNRSARRRTRGIACRRRRCLSRALRSRRTRGAHDEPLTLYFPAYPDTANAGFAAQLPAQALARGSAASAHRRGQRRRERAPRSIAGS